MKNKLRFFLNRIGIDGAIFWSTINKGFGFVKGPLNIYFIIKFLTLDEQGTWYTFTNLSAMTILADLGFAGIITQFVSHEYANLNFLEDKIEGNRFHIDRFYALIKFAIRVYFYVVIAAEIVLICSGFWVFRASDLYVFFAWVLYTLSGSLGLIVSLLQSIYQGVDKVKIIQQNALYYSLISTFFVWILLFLGFNIWALAVGSIIAIPLVLILLINDNVLFWKNIYFYKVINRYDFIKEILPLQAKYAVSFASSYLISYLYVPTIFKIFGGSIAAKFGMTLAILSVVTIVSGNWLMTKTPKMNILVAQKKYVELDELFSDSIKKSLVVYLFLNILFLIFIYLIDYLNIGYSSRLLDLRFTSILVLTNFFALISSFLSSYLRCFKKEPFLIVYLVNGLFVLGSIYYFLVLQMNILSFLTTVLIFSAFILFPVSVYLFCFHSKRYKV